MRSRREWQCGRMPFRPERRIGFAGEQDRGWNCEAPDASTRSSFNTTSCLLEGLLEHERSGGGSPKVTAARLRASGHVASARAVAPRLNGKVVSSTSGYSRD